MMRNPSVHQQIPTHIPLSGVCNARHLGGYHTASGTTTRDYALIRCEAPTDLTDNDIAILLKLGVRTVIDLRNAGEIHRRPNPFASVPTVRLYHTPVFAGDADLARFDAMPRPRGYCWILDSCGSAYAEALRIVLRANDGVLFHCAAGKDRTGILAALLLLLAGVDRGVVAEEYAHSQVLLAPWAQRENAKHPHASSDDLVQLYEAKPVSMQQAIDHLQDRYGGVEGYLHTIGLSPLEVEGLQRKLTVTCTRQSVPA